MFNLMTLKNERKLVKKSLDKIYKIIMLGENNSLLTESYFQLNKLNEDIKSCKKVEKEYIREQIHGLNYDLRKLNHVYWNDKKLNKTIQSCIDDINVIYNMLPY